MEICQAAFLDSGWKASLFQSLLEELLWFEQMRTQSLGQRQTDFNRAKSSSEVTGAGIGAYAHLGTPNLCLAYPRAFTPLGTFPSFPLLLMDETNPASQALSLDGKTISPPTSSMHKMLGPAALHLLVQPHSRTNTALWAIYILFKLTLGNKMMHNSGSASLLCMLFTLPRQDLICLGLTMQRMSKTFESHLKKTERPNS